MARPCSNVEHACVFGQEGLCSEMTMHALHEVE